MGYGSYQASDWTKLKNSRGISQSSNVDSLFAKNEFQQKFDPRYINVRESLDSGDSPNSTPIILGFDVTGSMGYLAAEIAKNSLNKTITQLYDKQPVTNPHVMCAAFTEPRPQEGLQVTQFEADIRVVEQLLELKVGFGGNRFGYDSLVWYFAAKHTRIDSYEKRGKKGFLIGIGDEVCDDRMKSILVPSQIERIFADPQEKSSKGYSFRDLFNMASEKYEIFHIVTRMGSADAYKTWQNFMPGRVAEILPKDIDHLSELITTLLQIANGMDKNTAIKQWPDAVRPIIRSAVKDIDPMLFVKR